MAPAPSLSSRICCRQGPLRTMSPPCPPSIAQRKQASPWRAFETRILYRLQSPCPTPSHSGSKHHCGGPSKHVVAFPNRGPTPSFTAEASVASGEPQTPIVAPTPSLTAEASVASGEPQSPIVAPTPSLTAEANVASGEPMDLRAAESRRLMLVVVHTHLASDSASSVF